MSLSVNGVKGFGIVVVPSAERYSIDGESDGDMDLLSITTCHRDIQIQNNDKKFNYIYTPDQSVERDCGMVITSLEKKPGRHSWGYIEFENSYYSAPAMLHCNGSQNLFKSVSVCQGLQGTTQLIEFKEPMSVSPDPKCAPIKSEDKKKFYVNLSRGECVYVFMTDAKSFHKLTTLGYDSVLLKDD